MIDCYNSLSLAHSHSLIHTLPLSHSLTHSLTHSLSLSLSLFLAQIHLSLPLTHLISSHPISLSVYHTPYTPLHTPITWCFVRFLILKKKERKKEKQKVHHILRLFLNFLKSPHVTQLLTHYLHLRRASNLSPIKPSGVPALPLKRIPTQVVNFEALHTVLI